MIGLMEGACVMGAARVHGLGEEWVVETCGVGAETGWIRTTPRELAKRCLGGWGEFRQTHLGVGTPGLVFDGLVIPR